MIKAVRLFGRTIFSRFFLHDIGYNEEKTERILKVGRISEMFLYQRNEQGK